MAALVFMHDTVGVGYSYQQEEKRGIYNNNNGNNSRDDLMDDENMNNFSSDQPMGPTSVFAKSGDSYGISIGKYVCCPSSSSFMTTVMFLILAMWIIPYLLIISLLIACGIDTNISHAISYCGTHQHHLRPMFVATFCVNGILFSIVFLIRALVLYVKWFGLKRSENTKISIWRKILTCQFSNLKMPGRKEILSVPFWLIVLQVLPGVASNILLVIMAIYPDEKATKTEHFITAFLGLLLLVVYTSFSFVIQSWRLFRLCRGKTQPFHFVRHVDSLTSNKRRMYILSVSGLSISLVWHIFCMVGAIICIPIYLTKFIPIAEWIAVMLILLGMLPVMLDNMISIREGPVGESDDNSKTLLIK